MPKLVFEGDTQAEILAQVKRWLASTEGDDGQISMTEAVEQGAALTKDALRIIAAAAPKPVHDNELVKALTGMGYKATDLTRERLVQGLGHLDEMTGGSILKAMSDKAGEKGRDA